MVKVNYRKYRHASTRTDFHEFAGRTHWVIAETGWAEVAAFVQNWVEMQVPPGADPN